MNIGVDDGRILRVRRAAGAVMLLASIAVSTPAWAARWTLIDFGTSDGTTEMPYPAWTNLLRHPSRTQYVDPDGDSNHWGITETDGIPEGQWAYYGVSGSAAIAFRTGQTIVATFYNNSDDYIYLETRISLVDADAPDPTETNMTWFTMQNRFYKADGDWMPPRELVAMEYYISDSNTVSSLNMIPSAGNRTVINVSKPYNENRFILTKIELTDEADMTAPTAPSNLAARLTQMTDGAGSNLVALTWLPATDTGPYATGVSRYLVYRDGALYDVLSEDEVTLQGTNLVYIDLCVVPGTTYSYRVSALDNAPYGIYPTKADMSRRVGNESARAGPVSVTTGAWRANALIHPSVHFEYMGAVRLPEDMDDYWGYASGGLAYNPTGNPGRNPATELAGSLFAYTQLQKEIAEIAIPIPVLSTNVGDLARARLLKGPTNLWPRVYGGSDPTVPPGGTEYKVAGLAYHPATNGVAARLYYSTCNFYGSDAAAPCIGTFDTSLTQATGAWHVGGLPPTNVYPGLCGRLAFAAQQGWAVSNAGGRSLIVGNGFLSGGDVIAHGPSLYAVAPWQTGALPTNGGVVTAVNLLRYSDGAVLSNRVVNWARDEYAEGGAWLQLGGRSAVALSYRRTIGDLWYGDSLGNLHCTWDIPEPPMGDKGIGASYWKTGMMLYNPDDLADVAAGTMDPWEPQPYAVFDMDRFSMKTNGGDGVAGALAYDPASNLVFFIEHNGDPAYEYGYALIHVWRLRGVEFQPTLATRQLAGGAVEIRWDTEADASVYQLQARTNLMSGAWTNHGPFLVGDGRDKAVTNTPVEAQRYFRVERTP